MDLLCRPDPPSPTHAANVGLFLQQETNQANQRIRKFRQEEGVAAKAMDWLAKPENKCD
jgi:hypothetical protein